jgi:regulator of replication initiation timing
MIILLIGAGFLFYNAYSNILTEIDGLQDEIEVLKDQNIKLEDENNQLQEELDAKLKREEAAAAAEGQKIAYITIDDGPTKYSNAILDTLKDLGVKATFFCKRTRGRRICSRIQPNVRRRSSGCQPQLHPHLQQDLCLNRCIYGGSSSTGRSGLFPYRRTDVKGIAVSRGV